MQGEIKWNKKYSKYTLKKAYI